MLLQDLQSRTQEIEESENRLKEVRNQLKDSQTKEEKMKRDVSAMLS